MSINNIFPSVISYLGYAIPIIAPTPLYKGLLSVILFISLNLLFLITILLIVSVSYPNTLFNAPSP